MPSFFYFKFFLQKHLTFVIDKLAYKYSKDLSLQVSKARCRKENKMKEEMNQTEALVEQTEKRVKAEILLLLKDSKDLEEATKKVEDYHKN